MRQIYITVKKLEMHYEETKKKIILFSHKKMEGLEFTITFLSEMEGVEFTIIFCIKNERSIIYHSFMIKKVRVIEFPMNFVKKKE